MKEEIIKGEGIREKKKGQWGRNKQKSKQNKEDEKIENKGEKKPKWWGKKKENKKKGFHQMAIKFIHTS